MNKKIRNRLIAIMLIIAIPTVYVLSNKYFKPEKKRKSINASDYSVEISEKSKLYNSIENTNVITDNVDNALDDNDIITFIGEVGNYKSELNNTFSNLNDEFDKNEKVLKDNSFDNGLKKLKDYRDSINEKYDDINEKIDTLVDEAGKKDADVNELEKNWNDIKTSFQPEKLYKATGAENDGNVEPESDVEIIDEKDIISETLDDSSDKSIDEAPSEENYLLANETDIAGSKFEELVNEKTDGLKNPIEIYNFIKNEIDYEPYVGLRKGIGGVISEMAGNDTDQAALLTYLLRKNGYATKYVKGNVFISIDKVKGLFGVDNDEAAANILASMGNKVSLVQSGSAYVGVIAEHTWVEVYVPYEYYRGLEETKGQPMWIPLDPSFKQYEKIETVDLKELFGVDDDQLEEYEYYDASYSESGNWVTNITNDYYESFVDDIGDNAEEYINHYNEEHPDNPLTTEQIIGGKKIIKEELELLPNVLPYEVRSVISESSNLSDDNFENISFIMQGSSAFSLDYDTTESFNVNFNTYELYGKRITIEWTGATDEDNEIINEYGGIINTPVYLIDVCPNLIVDGEVVATGNPVNAGYRQNFVMELNHIGLDKKIVDNLITVGGVYSVTLDYGNFSADSLNKISDEMNLLKDSLDEEMTEKDLYNDEVLGKVLSAMGCLYFAQLDIFDNYTANHTGVLRNRVLSEGITGYEPNVSYVFMTPVEYNDGRFYIDVDYNALSVVSESNTKENVIAYNIQSGLYSSLMESTIIEELFEIPAVSTTKLLCEANERGIPIYSICSENIEDIDELNVSDSVRNDVRNAVNEGKIVYIPRDSFNYYNWYGSGYMILDMENGTAAYMISGGISGGSTALDVAVAIGTIINVIFAVIDMVQLIALYATVTNPIVGILVYGLYLLSVYSFLDAIISATYYYQTGDVKYAAHILLDAAINLATFGLFKLLEKFIPKICAFWDNIIEKLKNILNKTDNLSEKAAKEIVEKSGEKALKEADEIAKALKQSNISDEAIEAAASKSGKEGLEKLSKAAEKVGAENADKLAKEGYNLDKVIELSDKGINPEKYAEYGIKNAKDAERAANYLDAGKSLDTVKEWLHNKRPTWRQSELDAKLDYPGYKDQVSFINGEEVPYGTKGSVRPDYYKEGSSIDIKNYKIESSSGRNNLVKNIKNQYYQRVKNLPKDTSQTVVIDVRGQNVSDEILAELKRDIKKETKNGIEVIFKLK